MHSPTSTLKSSIIAGVLAAMSQGVAAAEYQLLADPSVFQDRLPSARGYWGPGEDSFSAGTNPLAAASIFTDQVGNFGGVVGAFTTNDGGHAVFGDNVFSDGLFSAETSNPGVPFFNVPFQQQFDTSQVSSMSLSADRTATSTYHLIDSFGQKTSFSGSYLWLLPGDNPADYSTDADFLAHVQFLLDTLPAGWTWFMAGLETYVYTAGSLTGVQGAVTKAAYSLDVNAAPVPIPATFMLLVSALLGVGACMRQKFRVG